MQYAVVSRERAVRLCCLLLAGCCLFPAQAAEPDPAMTAAPPPSSTELANANAVALLAGARAALDKLAHPPAGDEPLQAKIYFDTAADSFTALYQLHGCAWAAPELRKLYARPDAPPLRIGHSPDGRVLLRVEPLPLQNPAYTDYTVLLCTFGSQTARDVADEPGGSLELSLPDGSWAGAHRLDPSHPLWPNLMRLSTQFDPPALLPSGAGFAFKQLYAIPLARLPLNACTLSLDWGGYHFELPRWVDAPAGASDG